MEDIKKRIEELRGEVYMPEDAFFYKQKLCFIYGDFCLKLRNEENIIL